MNYIAHTTTDGRVQTVKSHLENTAKLAESFSVDKLKEINYYCGLLHDIGKYSNEFQRRINGDSIRVDHAVCGAKEIDNLIKGNDNLANSLFRMLMQLCIIGHHTGIPDCGTILDGEETKSLYSRMSKDIVDYSSYGNEIYITNPELSKFTELLKEDCKYLPKDKQIKFLIEKYAFLVRYCFSCLVDADSIDTRDFCNDGLPNTPKCNFDMCESVLHEKLSNFKATTELQKARHTLQEQAFKNIEKDANIYLMNMPTGSGKTLASMYCALRRIALSKGKLKRIIYVIPYNSIIDQTAEVFGNLFGSHTDIIRHQSSFVYDEQEGLTDDFKVTANAACENWDAGIVITTAVQFFESLYSNKRSKLRKVHNMANSIIIFDEAHLLPDNYIEPCLRGIYFLTKYTNSEAMLLTATMPNFYDLLDRCTAVNANVVDLIPNKSDFDKFKKCTFSNLGEVNDEELISKVNEYASSLIVVNSKKRAREVYLKCKGEKYHLSTYMTAYDRINAINKIKTALSKLYEDFPDATNVPENRRIVVVSTSLIEAGVDLDFVAAFRELNGLDNVIQTGGRCNREGLRKNGEVFTFKSKADFWKTPSDSQKNSEIIFSKYADVSSVEAIEAYYKTYYNMLFMGKPIHIANISEYEHCTCTRNSVSIPFQEYSDNFILIEDDAKSVVVCRDDYSRELYETLQQTGIINERKVRKYSCAIKAQEFEDLLSAGLINDFGSGIYFLTNDEYYDPELGIKIN